MSEIEQITSQLNKIDDQLTNIRTEIDTIKNNHFHDLDLRLTKLETSISVGWKAVIFGAGIPAIISAILSAIQVLK